MFAVDYRWSTFGGAEMRDVAGTYDWLSSLTPATPIVLLGASHGGYMALLAASRPAWQRHWAAVVDLYGFVDLGRRIAGHQSSSVAATRS